ncbi:MAG: L-fucose isomerase [Deltaproteobacteria bacterium]|nr:L-fucose isomerase [Candidatus Zymogenaceae bacterium]
MTSYKRGTPTYRLNGTLPRIGIRPVIDGRRNGVRESLEGPIMRMAESTASLITENVRHASGHTVECVIADTTIGGAAEAARCAEKFRREGVGAVIDVTRCWCYGAEVVDMTPHLPRAIWGFNGTKKPGAVYLAGAQAVLEQKGLPVFKIYGKDVQDEDDFTIPDDVREQILRFVRCAVGVGTMKGTSYLSIGGVAMGIGGSIVDADFFQDYFGMRVEYVDMTEIIRRVDRGIYDRDEYERAIQWARENCPEMDDPNPKEIQRTRKEKDADWEMSVKMALIVRDLMIGNPKLAEMGHVEESEGHNAIAAGFQGQRQWTDHFPNGDFMEAMLNSSFDWDGIRQPYIVATENDSLNAAAMLFGHLLSGTAQIFVDVRTYWSPEAIRRVSGETLKDPAAFGFFYLTNSGAAAMDGTGEQVKDGKPALKPFWGIEPEDADRCVKAVWWGAGKLVTFRGGGFSSAYCSRGGMPLTMSRINLVRGLGPVLQLAEGVSVELPEKVYAEVVNRTDPTWPRTFFAPRLTGKGAFRDVYSVMRAWGANHAALCYGHIGKDLITLASMLRIPVAVHNVDEKDIFRPGGWNAFGTNDLEGADYRASAAYGPLYG